MKQLAILACALLVLSLSGCSVFTSVKVGDRSVMKYYKEEGNGTPIQLYAYGCNKKGFVLYVDSRNNVYMSCENYHRECGTWWDLFLAGPGKDTKKLHFSTRGGGGDNFFKQAVAGYQAYPFRPCEQGKYCVTTDNKKYSRFILTTELFDTNGSYLNYMEYLDYTKELNALEILYLQLSGGKDQSLITLSPETVQRFLDEKKAIAGIEEINSKSTWDASHKLAERFNLLGQDKIQEAYKNKYLVLDYHEAFTRAVSLSDLEKFINTYEGVHDPDKLVAQARGKQLDVIRNKNTFDDFITAFNMSGAKEDLESAYRIAEGAKQKSQIEEIVFSMIGFDGVFEVQISERSSPLKEFSSSSFIGGNSGVYKEVVYTVNIQPKQKLPFPIKYNSYTFDMKIEILPKTLTEKMQRFMVKQEKIIKVRLDKHNDWKSSMSFEKTIPFAGKITGFFPENRYGRQHTTESFKVVSVELNKNISNLRIGHED